MKDIRRVIEDYDRKSAGAMTRDEVVNYFHYHAPQGDQAERYEQLTTAFRELALLVLELTPACADQTVAIRKLIDARMASNMCIACNE